MLLGRSRYREDTEYHAGNTARSGGPPGIIHVRDLQGREAERGEDCTLLSPLANTPTHNTAVACLPQLQ